MYFSVIRNRGQKKNGYIFKIVIIVIAIIMSKTILNVVFDINIVKNGRNIVVDIKDKIIYNSNNEW